MRLNLYYLNPLQSTSDNTYGTIGKWKLAWQQRAFRNQLIVFVVVFLGVLIAFPHFFSFIESRRGYEIADPLLYRIPAIDLSPITFSIIWLMSLWGLSMREHMGQGDSERVEIAGLYWHFVDVVWIVIFTVVYLVPN